jgi:general secretion pathway protein D
MSLRISPPWPQCRLSPRQLALFGLALFTAASIAGENGGLSSIAEREVQRRQAAISGAETKLTEGIALHEAGKFEEANQLLGQTYQSVPAVPAATDLRNRLRAAYSISAEAYAKQLLDAARYQEAAEIVNVALAESADPTNSRLLRLRTQMADPDRYAPALTPKHINNQAEVKRALLMADSLVSLGSFDKAIASFKDALRIDPYNTAARRGMEQVEQHREKYFAASHNQHRAKMLNGVSQVWEDAVPPSANLTSLFASSAGGGSISKTKRETLEKKLRTLVLPKIEFAGASLDEVIEYVRVVSKNVDPEGLGISLVVNVDPETRARVLSLTLQDVPVDEVLRYATEMTGTNYRVEENAVIITSVTERSTAMTSKQYRVPPDFIQTSDVDTAPAAALDPFAPAGAAASAQGLSLKRMGAKEFLISRGVTFPEGAAASFSPASSALIVRNNAENLALIDMLVEQALGAAPKQVLISVKMIDMTETTFNELGASVALGASNLPGSERAFVSGGQPAGGSPLVTAGLRESGLIYANPGVTELLRHSGDPPSVDSTSARQLTLLGVMTDPQFDVALRALSQKKGSDLVANPTVVAKAGQKASVRVVREFLYPVEFDPPQVPQNISPIGSIGAVTGNTSGPVLPATPTAFEMKELGTILEVEPTVSADGRTVEVIISPSIVDFEGFIDYGDDISNAIDGNVFDPTIAFTPSYYTVAGTRYIQPNDILQPVFRKVSTSTAVSIYDGQTVAIGGLLEQRSQEYDDKVPVVGSIPLLGRGFQAKMAERTKRGIMIFVTVKVIDPSGQAVDTAAKAAGAQ